jgi:hypothetical protein
MRIIPDISPKTFTLSAVIIGYLLIDDTTANEQNALGNWLMLIAQVLCTNAFYKQVQQERSTSTNQPNTEQTIQMIQKMIDAMSKEIDNLKKQT